MGRRMLNELKYIHKFTDRSGTVRRYFRRNGACVALPGLPGSAEYDAAYLATLAGTTKPDPFPRTMPAAGTMAVLATRYYGSPGYKSLAPSSRANYRRVIDGLLVEHGHRLVKQITRERVDIIIGRMSDRPGAGIVLLKRLRGLLSYAVEIGWLDRNPASGATSYSSNEFHTWTEAEIAAFEARHPIGSRERLAFALLLYTGQRGSDVHRMTWADIAGDTIRVTQTKTKARLIVPLHPALSDVLAKARREHVAILTTAYGQPFSVKGFGNMMSNAIRAAGLPGECKAHGLRKAAARRLAEAGATTNEIGAITGHKTLAEVERYTAAASQERLARAGMKKQAENDSVANFAEPDSQTANRGVKSNA